MEARGISRLLNFSSVSFLILNREVRTVLFGDCQRCHPRRKEIISLVIKMFDVTLKLLYGILHMYVCNILKHYFIRAFVVEITGLVRYNSIS